MNSLIFIGIPAIFIGLFIGSIIILKGWVAWLGVGISVIGAVAFLKMN